MTITPDGSTIYVGDGLYGSVSVINTASKTVTTRITTVHSPLDLVVSPDGKILYVAGGSVAQGPVTLINTATNRPITEILVGNVLRGIAISPDGKTIYATVTTPLSHGVAVIDTATRTVSGGITLGSASTQPALSPDGTIAYVTHIANGLVSVVDTATGTVIATIPVGTDVHPAAIIFSANGDFAYVTDNSPAGSLSVIWTGLAAHKAAPTATVATSAPDATTGAVTLTVTTADADGDDVTLTVSTPAIGTLVNNGDGTFTYTLTFAERIAAASATPESLTFIVTDAHGLTGSTTVDLEMGFAPNTVVKTMDTGLGETRNIVVSADGKTAYTVTTTGWVAVIDLTTNTVTSTFNPGGSLRGLALSPDGKTLWTIDFGNGAANSTGRVLLIDTATKTIRNTFTTTRGPYVVTLTPDGKFAYIGHLTNFGQPALYVLDTQTLSVVATFGTGGLGINDIAVLPDGSAVYALGGGLGAGFIVIDTESNTVRTTIAQTIQSRRIAVSADSSTVYIAGVTGNQRSHITIVDTATDTVRGTIDLTGIAMPEYMAVSPDNSTLFVSNANSVTVIDVATKAVINSIPFSRPTIIKFSSDGATAYVSSLDHSVIGVIATGIPPYTPPAAV
jgi:YVTN family beta-propeller protein